MPSNKQIGERLRGLRKKRKMTIADVAAVLGIAPSTLTAYELGSRTPRDGVKEKIADYYGKSVSAIFLTKLVTNRDKRGGEWHVCSHAVHP